MDEVGHVAAAPGPLACPVAAALGALACTSRSARPRKFLNLTLPYLINIKNVIFLNCKYKFANFFFFRGK